MVCTGVVRRHLAAYHTIEHIDTLGCMSMGCSALNEFKRGDGVDMDAWGRRFTFALRYFTRIPIPFKTRLYGDDIARSCSIWPLVGGLESLFVVLMARIGAMAGYGYAIAAAALLGRMIIGRRKVRAAAHSLDGFGSSRDRVRMVKIMLDKRYGTIGVLTFLFDFLFKAVFYYEIFENMSFDTGIMILIASCIAPKLALAAGATTSRSVFGHDPLIDGSKPKDLWICTLFTAVFFYLVFGWQTAILLVVLEISIGLIFSGVIVMRLGGLTKQTLGLIHEVGEIMMLYILLIW